MLLSWPFGSNWEKFHYSQGTYLHSTGHSNTCHGLSFPLVCGSILKSRCEIGILTEHGVKLLRVQIPLSPGGLMAFGLGIAGMVKLRLGAERVQDTQHAPARKSAVGKTATLTQSSGNKSSNPSFRHCQKRDRHLKKKIYWFQRGSGEGGGREGGKERGRSSPKPPGWQLSCGTIIPFIKNSVGSIPGWGSYRKQLISCFSLTLVFLFLSLKSIHISSLGKDKKREREVNVL